MAFALPTDTKEPSGLSLVRRVWVAKFDVEEEAQGLAQKYVGASFFSVYIQTPYLKIRMFVLLQTVGVSGSGAGP